MLIGANCPGAPANVVTTVVARQTARAPPRGDISPSLGAIRVIDPDDRCSNVRDGIATFGC